MSIWGKVLGGAAGFAIGGPIGALLGAVAGHAVDSLRPAEAAAAPGGGRDETQEIAFTIGVIVLSAKMAKADGTVTRDEIAAFREVFHVPPDEIANVGRLFDLARRDSRGFEPYARQIAKLLHRRRPVLEKLLDGLFHIARADGGVHEAEIAYLREVAGIFGFDAQEFERIRASNGAGAGIAGPGGEPDPYHVLGVERTAPLEEIRAAHRRLVRENHPDLLVGQGMPPEFVAIAEEQVALVNAAWDRIRRERGAG
jgi:DnaJ like chaperone protein